MLPTALLPVAAAVTPPADVCSSGCPYTSIDAAVADGVDLDILVGDGTWDTPSTQVTGTLVIRALNPGLVLVSGATPGQAIFRVAVGADLTLDGLHLVGDERLVDTAGTATLTGVYAEGLTSPTEGLVAHAADGASLTIRDSTFVDLQARYGAVASTGNGPVLLENVIVQQATAVDGGGAAVHTRGPTTILGSNFEDCDSFGGITPGGGAVQVVSGMLAIDGSSFLDGETSGHGGQVYFEDTSNGTVTVTGTTFTGGRDTFGGGCLFVWGSGATQALLTDTSFTGCTSPAGGGSLFALQLASLEVDGGSFALGRSDSEGGAMLVQAAAALTVDGTRFESNQAPMGGAISTFAVPFGSGSVAVQGAWFSDNVSTDPAGGGGAIHADGAATVDVSATVFKDNDADWGGALKGLGAGAMTVTDCFFLGNTATNNGGGVWHYNPAGPLVVQRSLFAGNSATGGGGAVAIETPGVAVVRSSAFVENDGFEGGALYSGGAGLDVQNCDLLGNTSDGPASAAYYLGAADFTNVLVAWNDPARVALFGPAPTGVVRYSAFYQNGTHAVPRAPDPIDGNLVDVDPELVAWNPLPALDAFDDDLHPLPGSPLLDAGDPAVLDDAGGPSDIGLYGGESPPVDADGDGWWDPVDCGPTDALVYPLAADPCDGLDNDCDGQTDEDDPPTPHFTDADGDGFGDPGATTPACGPAGPGGDCDDGDATVFPGAEETCSGIDEDCDQVIDEGFELVTVFGDADGDGWGDDAVLVEVCVPGPGHADRGRDCDDADGTVHPEAAEQANDGVDQDCSGDDAETSLVGGQCGCASGAGGWPLLALLALRRRRPSR